MVCMQFSGSELYKSPMRTIYIYTIHIVLRYNYYSYAYSYYSSIRL